jgi:hypothetical protein
MWSWSFRELWGLTGYLRDDLEQAEAAAQAKWYAEHAANGAHADVTALSVAATLLSGDRLSLSSSVDTQAPESSMGDLRIKAVKPPTPTAIVGVKPSDTDDITLWGMSTDGRALGEIVLLRAAYDYGLTHFGFFIRSNSAATPPSGSARFLTFGDGTGSDYDAISLGVGETLVLRLESCQATPTSAFGTYWRTLGKLSV